MQINNSEILARMKSVKTKIEKLIEQGRLKDAAEALDKYEKMLPEDIDICSMRAVILIMEGKLHEAEDIIKEGLKNDSCIFDLLFNLGYINQQNGKYQEAADMYSKAVTVADTDEKKSNVKDALNNVKNLDNTVVFKEKKRLVFFIKRGMDSFIDDIISGVSEDYWTRKIIVDKYKQIDDGMKWADICWFEWCDELINYGSKLELAIEKRIICRLHSYEAFTDYPKNVNWDNVDKLIFVAQHIKEIVLSKISISEEKAIVIYNGIDLNKYAFKKREKGFNIAYVGYINYKKGPMLLLHAFNAIHDFDNRYVLHIAGEFQDERDVLYFNQMIDELRLRDSVKFDGWQSDINQWLEGKNYIICSSLLESQNLSVMQAMVKGIKPLIHNFVGARNVYPSKYIWNTFEELVQKINDNNYASEEYHSLIESKYNLSCKIAEIEKTIKDISINKTIPLQFNYASYWNNRLNQKFDIEGVGYIGLGNIYNSYLYKIRFDVLEYIVKKIFSDFSERDVLELGPGIGMFTEYFCQQQVRSYKGIDISAKSVFELNKKYTGFEFIEGDISESRCYGGKKYDLIFAADVLLHLTDEEKYYSAIGHISDALKDKGFFVTFDPVSLVNTKSPSSHVRIRDINYIKKVLDDHSMEVVALLPTAFFMNYPFDKVLVGNKSNYAEMIFNTISAVFGSNQISDYTKKCIAEWLYALEKKCLIDNEVGLSQKVLVIKKKDNISDIPNFSIKEVWDKACVIEEIARTYKSALNNNELNNLNIINKFNDYIKYFTNDNMSPSINNTDEINIDKPLITIGIINYNCKQYLHNCVQSFLNQTYPNIELILIDDCSTDGSKEIIQDFEQKYTNIRALYHDTNSGGASKGIQEVFANANGKYVQWIASDDYVTCDAIAKFVEYMEKNPDKDYVYSNFNVVNEDNQLTSRWVYDLPGPNLVVFKVFNTHSGVIPMNCLLRVSFLRQKGLEWLIYRGNDFSADTLNSLAFIKAGMKYGHINEGLINYRVHSQNLSHSLKKRVICSVSIFDYIIKNFNEEIYLPGFEWSICPNRSQFKNVVLAQFYYDQIENNLTFNQIPEYLRHNTKLEDMLQYVQVFVEEGLKYIEDGLTQGDTYLNELKNLKAKFEDFKNRITEVAN